jgi:hypothetical protein
MFSSHLQKVRESIETRMPGWQKYASFDRNGAANEAAANAAMGKLVLSILDDTSADNVIFLADENNRHLPLRLNDIAIDGEGITLTVQPTTSEERQEILDQLKAKNPEGKTAAVETGKP